MVIKFFIRLAAATIIALSFTPTVLEASYPPDSIVGGYRIFKHYIDFYTDGEKWPDEYRFLGGEGSYDSLGRLTDCIEYKSVGVVILRRVNQYNDCGCRAIFFYGGADTHLIAFVKNLYNENCQKVHTKEYLSDSSFDRETLYKYDSNGRKIDEISYEANGSMIYHNSYCYDSAGRVCEELWLDPNGKLSRKNTRKYNEVGKEIEYKSLYEGYYCDGRTISNYNSRNELVEEINFDVSGVEYDRNHYRYDERGNKIEFKCILTEDGSIKQFEQYEYDNYGNLTVFIDFDTSGNPKSKSTYIYSK